jgi:hypothetical protein
MQCCGRSACQAASRHSNIWRRPKTLAQIEAPSAGTGGKKAQAMAAALTAGKDSDWGDDLEPPASIFSRNCLLGLCHAAPIGRWLCNDRRVVRGREHDIAEAALKKARRTLQAASNYYSG